MKRTQSAGPSSTASRAKLLRASKNRPAIRGGNSLEGTPSATSIRRGAGGELSVTDGPFVETKEALGGYYLIEAADLDDAIAVAKQVPAHFGGVEVRPVRALG